MGRGRGSAEGASVRCGRGGGRRPWLGRCSGSLRSYRHSTGAAGEQGKRANTVTARGRGKGRQGHSDSNLTRFSGWKKRDTDTNSKV